MLQRHLTTIPFEIKPGRDFAISKQGTFLLCTKADGLFDVKVDDHVSLNDFLPGLTFEADPGEVFQTITLRNRGSDIVAGTLAVGHGKLGSNATLGAVTIDGNCTLRTALIGDGKLLATQWPKLEAHKWVSMHSNPNRTAVCIVAQNAKMLWRIAGIESPAPWDGIVTPAANAWVNTADSFEFCVTAPANVTLYERYCAITSNGGTPPEQPMFQGGSIADTFKLEGKADVSNPGILEIPAQLNNVYLIVFARQDVWIQCPYKDNFTGVRTRLLVDGAIAAEADTRANRGNQWFDFRTTVGVTHGFRLDAGKPATLKLTAELYARAGGWNATNQNIHVLAFEV